MRLLVSKDSGLSSCFDKNGEKPLKENNVLKQILINNHTVEAKKGRNKGHFDLEDIFGFFKTFKKINKNLGFHPTFKMTDLQDIIFKTLATHINITIHSLYYYVAILIPNSQTQLLFIESIVKNYRIIFDSWYTERKI